jgi:RsiW-degrading membrane proteinase PrsW (M82 family)
MLVAGLLFLALAGAELGMSGLIVAVIASMLPVPIYVALVLWIDRIEAEPPLLLGAGFLWGASISVLVSYIFNSLFGVVVGGVMGSEAAASVAGAVIAAPISEEISKGLFLFLLFFFMRKEFDGVIDGIVYASMSGLGFAMAENFLYLGREYSEGGVVGLVGIFGLRNVISPFAHPLFTALTGIGLGYACTARSRAMKIIAPTAGLLGAIGLHALWNLLASLGLFWLGYALVFVPAFILLLAIIIYSLYREQLILRRHLQPHLQSGAITPQEFEIVTRVIRRFTTGLKVLANGGISNWFASRRFNQAASELAFEHHRAEHGNGSDIPWGLEREAVYLTRLGELRQRFTWPAQLPRAGGKAAGFLVAGCAGAAILTVVLVVGLVAGGMYLHAQSEAPRTARSSDAGAAPAGFPATEELSGADRIALVGTTMRTFQDSIDAGSFARIYEPYVSNLWKAQMTAAELDEALNIFLTAKPDLAPEVFLSSPSFTKEEADGRRALLQGYYTVPSADGGSRVIWEFDYVFEENRGWGLTRILVNTEPLS